MEERSIRRQPKNTMPRIESIWAFLSVDEEDGNEGVIAHRMDGVMMPLIAADLERLESITPLARAVAEKSGKKVVLAKFSFRKDIEVI